MLKFIILSDLHIVPEGELSHGLDTTDRLQQSIDFVNANHGDADFVIFAGDLADHGERAAYECFKSSIQSLTLPYYLTLGNHDQRSVFLDVFGEDFADETRNINHVIDHSGHRVIVLDSSDPSVGGAGKLEQSQLNWLQNQLDDAKDLPVIIVLHHNITKLHVQTDFIILKDNEKFAQVVASHPDIRQVISGHVHMTTAGTYKGIPFCTLAGGHYNIEPVLESESGGIANRVPRREGPGQLAVVLADKDSTVVHMENFIDRHLILSDALFKWHDEIE
jgi:3',5'-cyclic AMP phosphodiesterase CpdA